jgi:hypothetical protein
MYVRKKLFKQRGNNGKLCAIFNRKKRLIFTKIIEWSKYFIINELI